MEQTLGQPASQMGVAGRPREPSRCFVPRPGPDCERSHPKHEAIPNMKLSSCLVEMDLAILAKEEWEYVSIDVDVF